MIMKNYKITVNGNVYDVSVEETGSVSSSPASPAAAKAAVPVPPAAVKAAGSGAGAVKVNAPMPGKVLSVKVSVGEKVTKGQVLMILEAMKMENEIVAPQDGTMASIDAAEGSSVEAGAVLASLN